MNNPFSISVVATIAICLLVAFLGLPFGYFFITLGILPVGLSIFLLYERFRRLKRYKKTTGIVVELIEKKEKFPDEATSYSVYYPVVSFSTYEGKKITAQWQEAISPSPQPGEEVSIGYNPGNPEDFTIINHNYLNESIFGGVGLLFIIIGTCFVIFRVGD
ncbi:MAG: DUF3592 domain-containing protein [Bacteroidetes bacterium]|nr:DUF3592 domain-containing protein [Bacteroidota bacterium]